MDPQNLQEILKRVDGVGDKLSQALHAGAGMGQEAFNILVRQKYIDGWRDAGFGVVMLIGVAVCVKWMTDTVGKNRVNDTDAVVFLLGLASLVMTIFACVAIYSSIGELMNPQYYAMAQILDLLHGK